MDQIYVPCDDCPHYAKAWRDYEKTNKIDSNDFVNPPECKFCKITLLENAMEKVRAAYNTIYHD